jgi:RHS repeat-associated protein
MNYSITDVVGYFDYLPFGQVMPNRHGDDNQYRYGFNGKEKLDEMKGDGNAYDFGARMLDPRIGRWLSRDPLEAKYPNISTYTFVGNSPIFCIDPDGKQIKPTNEPAAKVLNSMVDQMNRAGFTIDQNSNGALYEVPDTYRVINGVAGGEKNSVSSEREFSKKMKKYNSNLAKEEIVEMYSVYLGIQHPKVIEVQVTTTGTDGRDFTYGGSSGTTGSLVKVGSINTTNSEYSELNTILKNEGSVTQKVGDALYNQTPITSTTPANGEVQESTNTYTITPDKKGTGWVFFKHDGGGNTEGQIFIDGTNKTQKENSSSVGKAISEVIKN